MHRVSGEGWEDVVKGHGGGGWREGEGRGRVEEEG